MGVLLVTVAVAIQPPQRTQPLRCQGQSRAATNRAGVVVLVLAAVVHVAFIEIHVPRVVRVVNFGSIGGRQPLVERRRSPLRLLPPSVLARCWRRLLTTEQQALAALVPPSPLWPGSGARRPAPTPSEAKETLRSGRGSEQAQCPHLLHLRSEIGTLGVPYQRLSHQVA